MTTSYAAIKELISKTRTVRRFGTKRLDEERIHGLIDLGRLGGSARNGQPWQYMIVTEKDLGDEIFPCLGWAGYLADWKGPAPNEQPDAYILCLLNHDRLNVAIKDAMFDLGISSQNILLGATTIGIGGCRIGSISPKLNDLFIIPQHLTIELVIALGAPNETIVLEQSQEEDDTRYWRDSEGSHHVPKRPLNELLVTLKPKVSDFRS